MKSKIEHIVLHIIGCLMFLALPIIFSPNHSMDFVANLSNPQGQKEFFSFLVMILFFYFHHYFLIPKLFFKEKYVLYAASLIICLLLVYGTPQLFLLQNGHMQKPPPREQMTDKKLTDFRLKPPPQYSDVLPPQYIMRDRPIWFEKGQILVFFLVILFVSLTIRINFRWKQVEKEKINTELSYLRAQVNPHFLFNTLNSIYALAIEKSDETAEAITRLSSMMRYVLNETNKTYVSLEKEINYISDYIEI